MAKAKTTDKIGQAMKAITVEAKRLKRIRKMLEEVSAKPNGKKKDRRTSIAA